MDDDVQSGFKQNFHYDGYEYFISTDAPVDLAKSSIGRFVQSVTVNTTDPDRRLLGRCPAGTLMHRFLVPMVNRYVACYHEILAAERKNGYKYRYVLRARPDHLFVDRFPSAPLLLKRFAHDRDVLLLDDHIAVAQRSHAGTILLAPQEAYSKCHNLTEWSTACGVNITRLHSKGAPCCPMRMISNYEENSTAVAAYEFSDELLGTCPVALKFKSKSKRCFFR